MFSLATLPAPDQRPLHADEQSYLRHRMQGPQRHRLLHGYPLAAAMWPRKKEKDEIVFAEDTQRGLLVGVLPHPFCNPTVKGCGFCTFPHETYNADQAALVVAGVLQEIEQRLVRQPWLHRRPVVGLYFGGGTANLTPAEPFRKLCRRLAEVFDLSGAEVTLEGVPAYFVKRRPLLVDVLREEMPARHFRVSMGVQTFDEERLRQMGRLAFGTAATFREVVELAHKRGFTISADLLFNLPGQTLEQMRQDVLQAIDLGLDHVCLYHLVLFRGLGTAWSRDPAMLAGLPDNEQAAGNWLQLRNLLLESGFGQTTLTNFERARFRNDARRFLYEEMSFQPDRFDMLGFGPSAISFTQSSFSSEGLKTLNPDASEDYLAAVEWGLGAWDRYFDYRGHDLRIFALTRRLAALSIDRFHYPDPMQDFGREFEVLQAEELVTVTPTTIYPTPRGMFYADSIAALLAWRHVQGRRKNDSKDSPWERNHEESAAYSHMG
jgi:coproporphyrinogen III oxidase-like Fe-S oxidoreductase